MSSFTAIASSVGAVAVEQNLLVRNVHFDFTLPEADESVQINQVMLFSSSLDA